MERGCNREYSNNNHSDKFALSTSNIARRHPRKGLPSVFDIVGIEVPSSSVRLSPAVHDVPTSMGCAAVVVVLDNSDRWWFVTRHKGVATPKLKTEEGIAAGVKGDIRWRLLTRLGLGLQG